MPEIEAALRLSDAEFEQKFGTPKFKKSGIKRCVGEGEKRAAKGKERIGRERERGDGRKRCISFAILLFL